MNVFIFLQVSSLWDDISATNHPLAFCAPLFFVSHAHAVDQQRANLQSDTHNLNIVVSVARTCQRYDYSSFVGHRRGLVPIIATKTKIMLQKMTRCLLIVGRGLMPRLFVVCPTTHIDLVSGAWFYWMMFLTSSLLNSNSKYICINHIHIQITYT